MSSTPILLVDSFAQIYRCYHAVRHLSTADGVPTNAVFAMTKFLLKLEKEHPSENGAFVFDKGRPRFRMELAPDYKANRPPMPEELRVQLPVIRELIRDFGWSIVEHEGYEADDLIGSIAVAFPGHRIVIFSGDKDLSQMIDDRVEMLVPDPAGSVTRRGTEEVVKKFGVPPSGIVDYLALIGDASDNIPGVEGVGPKTAAALLQQFGSGEEIFRRLNEVHRESLRTKLEGAKELFEKNVKLVRLDTAPPENTVWELRNLKRSAPDYAKIRAVAGKMELKSILREIDAIAGPGPGEDLFAPSAPAVPEKTEPTGKTEASSNMTQMDLF